MNTIQKIEELKSKKQTYSCDAISKIEKILDENSFMELGGFDTQSGVWTGCGTIENKLVYIYCQDSPVSIKHARKIANIYENALKMGAPVIGILNSNGILLDEGTGIFEAYGILFTAQSKASGIIPQISIIDGDCLGTAVISPMLSDFVIMNEKTGKMFLESPATFEDEQSAKSTSYEQLGGADAVSRNSLLSDICCKDEAEAFEMARKLIAMLPSNNFEEEVIPCTDDLNREDSSLANIITDEETIDMRTLINSIADNHDVVELNASFAKNSTTSLVRLNGATVGMIGVTGELSLDMMEKTAEFVKFCDSFNIPVVTLTDLSGYDDSLEQERHGISKLCAKLLYTFSSATVPKVNVVIRNGIGGSYFIFNSSHISADISFAWPTAFVTLLDKKSATDIIGLPADEFDRLTSPYDLALHGYVDDIIIPDATRKRIIAALEILSSKRVITQSRKNGKF